MGECPVPSHAGHSTLLMLTLLQSSSLLSAGHSHGLYGLCETSPNRRYGAPRLVVQLVGVVAHPIELLGPALAKDESGVSLSHGPPPGRGVIRAPGILFGAIPLSDANILLYMSTFVYEYARMVP